MVPRLSYTCEGLPTGYLPEQLASAAACQRAVTRLGQRDIVHEWTIKPGKRLVVKLGSKFKETICGKGGPYLQFNIGLVGQTAQPNTSASMLLTKDFSPEKICYPLAVYVNILLVKTGLKSFCAPRNSSRKLRKTTPKGKRAKNTRL